MYGCKWYGVWFPQNARSMTTLPCRFFRFLPWSAVDAYWWLTISLIYSLLVLQAIDFVASCHAEPLFVRVSAGTGVPPSDAWRVWGWLVFLWGATHALFDMDLYDPFWLYMVSWFMYKNISRATFMCILLIKQCIVKYVFLARVFLFYIYSNNKSIPTAELLWSNLLFTNWTVLSAPLSAFVVGMWVCPAMVYPQN